MLDDAAHAVDLSGQGVRTAPRWQARAHDRQGRLQAVGEIAERVAIATHALALSDEERVQIAGDAGQFARIAAAECLAATILDLMDLALQAAHGRQHPMQQRSERQEQRQHEPDEPAEQLAGGTATTAPRTDSSPPRH